MNMQFPWIKREVRVYPIESGMWTAEVYLLIHHADRSVSHKPFNQPDREFPTRGEAEAFFSDWAEEYVKQHERQLLTLDSG